MNGEKPPFLPVYGLKVDTFGLSIP